MWNTVYLISAGNNIYDNNISVIILLTSQQRSWPSNMKVDWSDNVVDSNVVLQCICSTIVEENPWLTVYDVVDPSKTIYADFSQSNITKFRQNTSKQRVATSLTAIIHKANRIWDFMSLPSEDLQNVMRLLNIIHYLNHIHYLVRKYNEIDLCTSILVQCQKSRQNSVKPWLKNHAAIRTPSSSFQEFTMMSKNRRQIIADPVEHVSMASDRY